MELKEGYIRKQLMKVRVELLLEFYANIFCQLQNLFHRVVPVPVFERWCQSFRNIRVCIPSADIQVIL